MTSDEKLEYCIEQWVTTFNDCACCPLYPSMCDGTDDEKYCYESIIEWIKENDK
jgi:hypothetical protein